MARRLGSGSRAGIRRRAGPAGHGRSSALLVLVVCAEPAADRVEHVQQEQEGVENPNPGGPGSAACRAAPRHALPAMPGAKASPKELLNLIG